MFKLFLRINRSEFFMLLLAVVVIAVGVALDLEIPRFTEQILIIAQAPAKYSSSAIWEQGALMLLCTFGSVLTVIIVGYLIARISASHSARIRLEIFEKVGAFSTTEMKKFSVSSLVTRGTNDVTQIRMFIAMGLQFLIRAPLMAVFAIINITNRSYELSIVTAISVFVLVVFISFMVIVVMPKFRRIQKLTDDVNMVARDNLTGIRVVRAYNAEQHEAKRFEGVNDSLTRNNLFTMRAFALMQPFMMILMSGMGLAIWYTGARIINSSRFTTYAEIEEFASGLPTFMTYSAQIVTSFMLLIIVFIMFPRASISASRINEVLDSQSTIKSGDIDLANLKFKNGKKTKNTNSVKLEFKDVEFRYPDAVAPILSRVSFSAKSGQTIAFIGSTGSGKSTLVNLLSRIYDVTAGEILISGVNIKDLTLEALNSCVGYISQTAVLFRGTIRSNIAFGEHGENELGDDDIWRALEIAQAKSFVEGLEKGLDAPVAQGGANLSGGQKQRISIARVIARRPDIFVFDDTFSALDYATDRALRLALDKATSHAIKLIVAQRIGTIKDADKIIVLSDGVIVGQGTHAELMQNCDVYQEIAYSQLSKEELA